MSSAFNLDPRFEVVDLDDYQEIPDVMVSRLSMLFGNDISPQDAMAIMREQRAAFKDDADMVSNFDLFAEGNALDDIYRKGRGDVAADIRSFYRHFATLAVEARMDLRKPEVSTMAETAAVQLEVVPERVEVTPVANELGKRATRFTTEIYGQDVEQLQLLEDEADVIASTTMAVFEENVKKQESYKQSRQQKYIHLLLQGFTDEQIAQEMDTKPAQVGSFFHIFKRRLHKSRFDQALALTTLERAIAVRRNPGVDIETVLRSIKPRVAATVTNLEPRVYADPQEFDAPLTIAPIETRVAMPDDYLVNKDEFENPDEWQALGLCKQTDPEIFFPEKGGSTREAKQVCQNCEVRDKCLQYALNNDERFGIWGGLSERERRKLKKAMEAAGTL